MTLQLTETQNMLRKFYPSSDQGAALYGGFMHDPITFCRIFEMEKTLEDSLIPINKFLEENGYEQIQKEELDETNCCKKDLVSLSPHGYQEQFVLFIDKDDVAVSQNDFIKEQLIKFRNERDWEQFHNPKDLSLAINVEAGELLELFLWKQADDVDKEKVKEELADVFSFAFLLAEKYKFDVEDIVLEKIKANAEKYPVAKAKGTAKKYNEL